LTNFEFGRSIATVISGENIMTDFSRRGALGSGGLALLAAITSVQEAAAQQSPPVPTNLTEVYKSIPQLGRIREEVLFGDVWKQPEMLPRDRSIATCAILAALGRDEELELHVRRAINNGVTPDELRGLAVHVAFYAGWPAGLSVGKAALPILQEAGTPKK
jgi:4-carboxymuconolactone decarboxylase